MNGMENRPIITPENTTPVFESRYVKVFDLQYAPGHHYYDATRRDKDTLVALKSDEEALTMLPDAVSCVVVLKCEGQEPKLLLQMEYRYPAGRFLLSVPAGLIDPADRETDDALFTTARREIHEETGLTVSDTDELTLINPFLYSTPGMSDECNALVGVTLHLKDTTALSQDGAEGSECFNGFVLLTVDEAKALLKSGRDPWGNFYSVYTFAALCWFAAGF